MYKDIISYELAEGVTEEQLLTVAEKVYTNWMSNQPGFIKWEINKNDTGGFTDIVYWRSKEHAKKSELDMINLPEAGEWFGCYKEDSITSHNLTSVIDFKV